MISATTRPHAVVIGAGPAGLMAAEVLANAQLSVDLYDAMPSPGRKFLLAGVGGMNITHGEARAAFVSRYGARAAQLAPLLEAFDNQALRQWIHQLGIDTFVGSSGRVFPRDMKAAPLLRAWLKRLREAGVRLHTRHRWQGWDAQGALLIDSPEGVLHVQPAVTVLALGGGSWPQLGSDGRWLPLLAERGVPLVALQPSNCGFEVPSWSPLFSEKFAGAPVKPVAIHLGDSPARQGEFVITALGVEGSLIYSLSSAIRQRIQAEGQATLYLDLLPSRSLEQLVQALTRPRGSKSMANHLRSTVGLDGARAGLLRELSRPEDYADVRRLAQLIKALPLQLVRPRPLQEAISSAGGVDFQGLDDQLMLRQLPGVFCAGEMLDWEAPTGGYLLTACFASGRAAGLGALRWLQER